MGRYAIHRFSVVNMVLRYRSTGNLRRTCAWRRACAAAAGLAVAATRALDPPIPACRCDAPNTEKGKGRRDEDGDEGGEDFDFSFAQPPVASAPINWQFSTRIAAAAIAGARPHAEVIACSTFSLLVERGWPRDTLSPEEVAVAMRDTLADRLPRWAAEKWRLALSGAPPPLRGLRGGWPRAAEGALPATLSWSFLPAPFPPLLTIRQLPQTDDAVQFELGGLACVGSSAATLCVACEALGTSGSAEPGPGEEVSERLDLKLTTSLSGLPVAGPAWSFLGCGGRWWWESYRLPAIRQLLRSFHDMAHEQMALHYVAALRS